MGRDARSLTLSIQTFLFLCQLQRRLPRYPPRCPEGWFRRGCRGVWHARTMRVSLSCQLPEEVPVDPQGSWSCSAPSRWSCAPSRRCGEVTPGTWTLSVSKQDPCLIATVPSTFILSKCSWNSKWHVSNSDSDTWQRYDELWPGVTFAAVSEWRWIIRGINLRRFTYLSYFSCRVSSSPSPFLARLSVFSLLHLSCRSGHKRMRCARARGLFQTKTVILICLETVSFLVSI